MKLSYDASDLLNTLSGNPNGCGSFEELGSTISPVMIVGNANDPQPGSVFTAGSRAAVAGAVSRLFQWVPQAALGSVVFESLTLANFAAAAIGASIRFLDTPAFLQLPAPAASWERGSARPMGTSNAFHTTDTTAAVVTDHVAIPAGGTLVVPLAAICDVGAMLEVQIATGPSDCAAWASWRNFGTKVPVGGFWRQGRRAG